MARPSPLLLIGLDVGDGALIRQWVGEDRLPVLGSLLRHGDWAWLTTPSESLHIAGWPSLYTGASPGDHGVYFTFQPAPGHQGWRKFGGDQYGRPTFWTMLAGAGVRCSVFDAPYTHPEPGSLASQVFEWGTWAHHWTAMSLPRDRFGRLNRACGTYPLGIEALELGLDRLPPAEMSRKLVAAARAKAAATAWLMDQSAWDLFFVVFGETHPAAHYCWAPSHRAGAADHGDLLSVYQAIDHGIGDLLEKAGAETAVAIVSADGAGPNHAGWHLLPEVLRRLGFLAEPPANEGPRDGQRSRPTWDPVRLLRDAIPPEFRKMVARRLPENLRQRLSLRIDTASIDWSRTRAYCLPTDLEGYVRVNLKGREPLGIVGDGAEYRRVCDELADTLSKLTDPVTGRRAVREIVRADERFPGVRRPWLPDLIVVWNQEQAVTALSAPGVGTVSAPSPDGRPGTHAGPGFLLRRSVPALGDALARAGHVCDIAPALLDHFGVPRPDHLRNRSLSESASRPGGAA